MLHLTAFDQEDLNAISVQLQDAVLKLGDIQFDRRRHQFAFVANRFAWDAHPEKQRRRTGVRFNHVLQAKRFTIAAVAPDTILSLLAITHEYAAGKNDPAVQLTLHFSGGHKFKLVAECIDVQLDDLGPAWGASSEPQHET